MKVNRMKKYEVTGVVINSYTAIFEPDILTG